MTPKIADLLPALYAVPDTGWEAFLEGFRQRMRAAQSVLALVDYRSGVLESSVHHVGITPDQAAEFMQKWAAQDPWAQRGDPEKTGDVGLSHEICPDEELETLPVYREFLGPAGWHYGAGMLTVVEAGMHANLSFARSKASGPAGEHERRLMRALRPHVLSVVALDLRLRNLSIVAAGCDRLPYGVALFDRRQEIVHANAAARRLLPKLKLKSLESHYVPEHHCWVIARPFEGPQVGIELCLLQPGHEWEVDDAALERAFGLTPTEARVTALLCEGQTLAESGDAVGISKETARTHLKRVLAKTKCRRQSELVALVLRLVTT